MTGMKRRLRQHSSDLRQGKHENKFLQNTFNKYGFGNFKFEIIELCSIEELDEREKYWINLYGGVESKNNFNFESGGHKNKRYSEIVKQKQSEKYKGIGLPNGEKTQFTKGHQPWNKGKKMSKEIKKILSNAHIGLRHSEETKKKLSIVNKGQRLGKERYNAKSVYAYDENGKLVLQFETIRNALEYLGIRGNYLDRIANKNKLYRGYYWKVEGKQNNGIRDLFADEIELRVGATKETGFQLLLYKNARVDMALLDEVVGVGNWQREHKILGNDIYCRVGIYNAELKQWIWREDAGAEANTEIEKSKASDSFKRACVNFGLGRCLYSAPFIWINTDSENNPKTSRYSVKVIDYKDHKIIRLAIINDKTKKVVYSYGYKENISQNADLTPKNSGVDLNEPKGSIETNDLKSIQAFISAFTREESRQKFYTWLDNTYGTMNVETLTKTQGKQVLAKINGKVK